MRTCSQCGGTGPFYRDSASPDGLTSRCKSCRNAASQAWQRSNPQYREQAKARTKAWRLANPERARVNRRAWVERNPMKKGMIDARYRASHSKERCRRTVAWRRANPEKSQAIDARSKAKRRATLEEVENTLTGYEWLQILEVFNHACAYCLRDDVKLTVDHVIPISRGGPNTAENVVPACGSCNKRKLSRPLWVMLGQQILQQAANASSP